MGETTESDRGKWLTEETADILPCPFCGEPPAVEASYVDTGSGDGAYSYRINCSRHLPFLTVAAGALGRHGYPRAYDPASDAAARAAVKAAWNARA